MDRQAAIDLILDHYENPRNRGPLAGATFSHAEHNPGCGDVVELHVHLDHQQHITAITFEGHGCTISQAAASVLTELAQGRPLPEILAMTAEDLAGAIGPEVVASRLPCVSLGLRALKAGSQLYQSSGNNS